MGAIKVFLVLLNNEYMCVCVFNKMIMNFVCMKCYELLTIIV